jgi:hypothetical protein
MKKISVSLLIITKQSSVKELAYLSGLQLSTSSHDIGNLSETGRPFTTTVGRFEIESNTGDLNAQIRRVLEKLDFVRLNDIRSKLSDLSLVMDIYVCFSTVNCTLNIAPEPFEILGKHHIAVEISCYPKTRRNRWHTAATRAKDRANAASG